MQQLSAKIDGIYSVGLELESSLSFQRNQLRDLARTIEFENEINKISELPEKLYKHVVYKEYDKAIHLWLKTIPVLRNHSKSNPDLVVNNEYSLTIKKIEQLVLSRWNDIQTPIDEASKCSILLTQIVPSSSGDLWKQYIEMQGERLDTQKTNWINKSRSENSELSERLLYLDSWNRVLGGFLDQFLPHKNDLLQDEIFNLHHGDLISKKKSITPKYDTNYSETGLGKTMERLKQLDINTVSEMNEGEIYGHSERVYGWQVMTQESCILAEKEFAVFSQNLVDNFEQTYTSLLGKYEYKKENCPLLLKHLDQFFEKVNSYPILLKTEGFKTCIGRIIRKLYESLFSKVFKNVVNKLFNSLFEYSNPTLGSEQVQNELFSKNIARLNLIYLVSKQPEKPSAFCEGLEKLVVSEFETDLLPLISAIALHYSHGSEKHANKGLNKPFSATDFVGDRNQLFKIFISILNTKLDNFFRDSLPLAISISFGIEFSLEHRNTKAAISRQNVDFSFIKSLSVNSNPIALLLASRFCIGLRTGLINHILAICEGALFTSSSDSSLLNSTSPPSNTAPSNSKEQRKRSSSRIKKSPLEKKSSRFSRHLEVDTNSLYALLSKITDQLAIQFIKIVGNDFVRLYASAIPTTISLYCLNSEDDLKGSMYYMWLSQNSYLLDQFHSAETKTSSSNIPKFNIQQPYNNISAFAYLIREWYSVLEDILLDLFDDNNLKLIFERVRKNSENSVSEMRSSESIGYSKFNANSAVSNKLEKSQSLIRNSPHVTSAGSFSNFSGSAKQFIQAGNTPYSPNRSYTSTSFIGTNSSLLNKVNLLFATKIDVYPPTLHSIYPSNILYRLSLVFLKGLVECWRGCNMDFFGSSSPHDLLTINFTQLAHLFTDVIFLKLLFSTYSQAVYNHKLAPEPVLPSLKLKKKLSSIRSELQTNTKGYSKVFSQSATRSRLYSISRNGAQNIAGVAKTDSLKNDATLNKESIARLSSMKSENTISSYGPLHTGATKTALGISASRELSDNGIGGKAKHQSVSSAAATPSSQILSAQMGSIFYAPQLNNDIFNENEYNSSLFMMIDDLDLAILNRYNSEMNYKNIYNSEILGADLNELAFSSYIQFF
ncbi:hypothetical protein BB560_003971 [Smittium megazygosporum]|uniref:Uncharacterized protein n=1 Tax=Smittium megazygosporum TaxID=133381 RepID=A0A2T9ZAM2_9FUNG|nr:hypothetical protein BB560_003971 [Smittium megazygosporum]